MVIWRRSEVLLDDYLDLRELIERRHELRIHQLPGLVERGHGFTVERLIERPRTIGIIGAGVSEAYSALLGGVRRVE